MLEVNFYLEINYTIKPKYDYLTFSLTSFFTKYYLVTGYVTIY